MSRSLEQLKSEQTCGVLHLKYVRRRDGVVIKIIRFMFPHGNSKAPASVTYGERNVLKRKLTHNKTRRRADKYKWTGKGRKRERLWRHVSRPSCVVITTVYPPMRMRFYQHKHEKRWENKGRDKTAATLLLCLEFNGSFNRLNGGNDEVQ
jgi:hypothetical protein